MPVVHFLNVREGDCSIIQHGSGRVTVIDVCNARKETPEEAMLRAVRAMLEKAAGSGNLNQKAHPVNPIEYLKAFNISNVFRFILTHPDMDHMDGIRHFIEEFSPPNFWDTDNNKQCEFTEGSPYSADDWEFYRSLRDGNPQSDPKRLVLYSGAQGLYWSQVPEGEVGPDGLSVLAPTLELVTDANGCGDHNDCSYVILYRGPHGRALFAGDAHDATWEHILDKWRDAVANMDLLIAPHHGRMSGRSYDFLDVVRPKLTLFGNARAEHLAYSAWRYRELPYITNNQANCVVVEFASEKLPVFVTNETFARQRNPYTYFDDRYNGWFLGNVLP